MNIGSSKSSSKRNEGNLLPVRAPKNETPEESSNDTSSINWGRLIASVGISVTSLVAFKLLLNGWNNDDSSEGTSTSLTTSTQPIVQMPIAVPVTMNDLATVPSVQNTQSLPKPIPTDQAGRALLAVVDFDCDKVTSLINEAQNKLQCSAELIAGNTTRVLEATTHYNTNLAWNDNCSDVRITGADCTDFINAIETCMTSNGSVDVQKLLETFMYHAEIVSDKECIKEYDNVLSGIAVSRSNKADITSQLDTFSTRIDELNTTQLALSSKMSSVEFNITDIYNTTKTLETEIDSANEEITSLWSQLLGDTSDSGDKPPTLRDVSSTVEQIQEDVINVKNLQTETDEAVKETTKVVDQHTYGILALLVAKITDYPLMIAGGVLPAPSLLLYILLTHTKMAAKIDEMARAVFKMLPGDPKWISDALDTFEEVYGKVGYAKDAWAAVGMLMISRKPKNNFKVIQKQYKDTMKEYYEVLQHRGSQKVEAVNVTRQPEAAVLIIKEPELNLLNPQLLNIGKEIDLIADLLAEDDPLSDLILNEFMVNVSMQLASIKQNWHLSADLNLPLLNTYIENGNTMNSQLAISKLLEIQDVALDMTVCQTFINGLSDLFQKPPVTQEEEESNRDYKTYILVVSLERALNSYQLKLDKKKEAANANNLIDTLKSYYGIKQTSEIPSITPAKPNKRQENEETQNALVFVESLKTMKEKLEAGEEIASNQTKFIQLFSKIFDFQIFNFGPDKLEVLIRDMMQLINSRLNGVKDNEKQADAPKPTGRLPKEIEGDALGGLIIGSGSDDSKDAGEKSALLPGHVTSQEFTSVVTPQLSALLSKSGPLSGHTTANPFLLPKIGDRRLFIKPDMDDLPLLYDSKKQ